MSKAHSYRQSCAAQLHFVIALCWTGLCILLVVKHCKSLSQQHVQMLWTYFQPLGPPLLMLGLWAQVIAHFEHRHIMFEACFPESERKWLSPAKDVGSTFRVYGCMAVGALAACTYLCTTSSTITPLLVPPVLYFSMVVVLIMPFHVLRRPSRLYFAQTLGKVLAPLQPVGWADFLLADMLTSLAKSSSDLCRSVCLMIHGECPQLPLVMFSLT